MNKASSLFLIVLLILGCGKPKPKDIDVFEYRYPKKVEWDKPEQVLKSFYGAKKRGDWEKAFSICDFEQVMPKKEAQTIREQWKKDAPEWKDRYMFRDYYVVERERDKDTAKMIVMEFYDSKDEPGGVGRAEYVEIMKKYGNRWKLSFETPNDEEK